MFETPLANHSYREVRQSDAFAWAAKTFGESNMSKRERARRFIEEAIELAQACGLDIEQVDNIVTHVYSKPPGQVGQEVGGVGLTLLCLCEAFGVSADVEERRELLRVRLEPAQHFRDRNNIKAAAGVAAPIEDDYTPIASLSVSGSKEEWLTALNAAGVAAPIT